jgi:hypothetical protein
MLIERIEKQIDLKSLKEDFRKLGINFFTAGIIGVFLNHLAGYKLSTMLGTAAWVSGVGVWFLLVGLFKFRGKNQ